jgi:hypothetical protein
MALQENLFSIIGLLIVLFLGYKVIKNVVYTAILIILLIAALWFFGFLRI